MAELDEKLLKALDDRLKNMLTTITSLDSALNTVVSNSKSSLNDLISLFQASGASLTDMLQAFKGNKLADMLGIQDAAGQVKQLNEQIETLNRNTRMGGKASLVEDADTGAVSWKVLEGDEFKNAKEERDAINALAKARQQLHDLMLSDSQLWEKIVALINKAAVETQKEESAKEREFQKAVKQQEELARKYAELEKLRSETFGGRSYGQLSGKEKVQWTEMGDALRKIKTQMEEIEKSSTGSKAEGERIFKEQEAIAKAKLDLAEKEKKAKEEAARQEKELNKAIADEARRKKEDENEYLRLLKERNKLLEQNARLAENKRNAGLTGYIDTSNYFGSQQDKNDARLRQLNDEIQLYEESVKLTADGQRRKEEMELAHENRMTEIKVQGEQKREQILDRSSKKRQSESERNARKAESIQKQADTLSKRRIDLNNEISRIEHDRVIRQRTNTNISQQALDAEAKKYQALKDMVDQLTRSLEELEKKQKGVTAKAEAKNAPYQQYTQAKEEERVNAELERRNKLLKDNKRTMDSMLPTLQRLASAFGIAFSVRGLAQFGKKLIETRGEFERQQVALRSILQNKQLADEIWDKTMQAALQSPFTAMQLTTYTKQLAAYRIETDKLFETTKRLADVSAGLGVDMQRLILAYGQVKAANYLRASEIRQFTEAGVNVLGELRDYFNDVKGMSVDTAKVMEMVTKRLVTFEDVEAIFKRMTDQGGIFFEMQYVQSQTVRGQIAKLHDAYDQMLNSIGQANEGVLKNMVSLLNSIVKNWQEFKTVIDLIAWPLLISFVYKFSRGLMTTATASRLASAEMSKVVIAGAKAKEMFTKLFATIAANPFIALGAAIAAVGVALLNHAKHVRDINKRYEDLMLRTYETQKNLDGLSDTLQKNLDTMKKATKGSEEYNEASRGNENIVKKLKDQYPELLQDLDLQRDGYEKLIEKIKQYNDELENQIRLEYAARASFGQDDLTTNIADLQETQRERQMQFLRNREKAEKKYLELKAQGKEAEEDEFDARMRNAKTWQEQNRILIDLYSKKFNIRDYERPIGFSALLGRDVGSRMLDLEKNIENEALVFNDIIRDQLKTINEDLGDDIHQFITDNETQINELFKDKEGAGWKLLNKQITKFFTAKGATDKETREAIQKFLNKYLLVPIQLDWAGSETTETATKELADWQKRVNEAIDKASSDFNKKRAELSEDAKKNMPEIEVYKIKDPLKTLEDAQSEILKKLNEVRAKIASYEVKGQVAIDNAEYQALKLTEQEMEQVRILLGAVAKVTGGGGHKENASKLISLIKEMRSEYDKLSKSAYGYAKSQDKVRKSYEDSVREILSDAGVGIDYDFTTNKGMIAALEKVKSFVQSSSKYAKDAWKDVQKYIDQLETEIEINAQVKIREDFGKQMEKAFNDYELTLDIEKLNLPSNVLAEMFDIETVDLSDLRNKVVQFYEEQVEVAADPTELVKQVEGYYKKIDDLERKQQRERIKEYAKYLEYELSERAKIEMEYVRKSAEVETTRGLTKEQRDAIDKRLKKERDEKLAKQEWEDFKSSETYIQMMEDLEHQGVGALEVMRKELERIRANAANLSPRALKEVVNALEKIDEITIKRGMPIGNIIRANAGIASAKEAAIGTGLEKEQVESRKAARDTLENIKKTILEREKEYRTLSNELGVEKELARLESERAKNNAKMEAMFGDTFAAESDEQIQQRIKDTVSNIEASRKNIAKYQEDAKEADEETLRTISTKVAEEESNLECLLAEMGLLEEALRLRLAIAKAEANRGDLTDEERQKLQERVEQLEEELKKLQAQAGTVGDVTKKYGILGDTWDDAFQKFGQWGSQVEQTFESFKGMMQALGTDVDTDTWDTLSTSFSVLNTATSTAASAAAKFAAGDYIGASLDIIKGLMDIATQIAELHDKKIDRSIEKSKERVEDLQKAYDRLEKSIEKTFDTVSYIREYNQEVQNLTEQIEEANNQIAAAQDYKNADKKKEAIEAAEEAKQQALDALDEIRQSQIEVFGGIGEDNYRSAAEGFVDAWKSAFLETGDGLQGLQDHFDEFLNDWFVKQATMQGVAKYYQKVFDYINGVVEDGSVPTYQQIENARLLADEAALKSDELMQIYASIFGLGGEGALSGLAAGIQGMTEEQANILEAYWNSVRGYTASIDMNVATIVGLLSNGNGGVGGGGGKGNIFGDPNVETNPMLKQLDLIAVNTAATHRILESVTKSGHSQGGYGIKVFAD